MQRGKKHTLSHSLAVQNSYHSLEWPKGPKKEEKQCKAAGVQKMPFYQRTPVLNTLMQRRYLRDMLL